MLRVAELVRHALSDLLARGDLNDPFIDAHPLTVARVAMSPDLKLATIYVVPLGGHDVAPMLVALERHRKAIRTDIAHRVNLKFAPDVRFRADDTFDKMSKIDALLNSEKVRRDLEAEDDADDELTRNDDHALTRNDDDPLTRKA